MSKTCLKCGARCCRYVTVKIPAPKDRVDRDEIRWFLHHENISVMIEHRKWMLQVDTRCKNLTEDHRCAIYAKRPDVCREYETDACDYRLTKEEMPILFRSPEEFDRFLQARKERRGKKTGSGRKKRK